MGRSLSLAGVDLTGLNQLVVLILGNRLAVEDVGLDLMRDHLGGHDGLVDDLGHHNNLAAAAPVRGEHRTETSASCGGGASVGVTE